ncbi:MAG: TetR/AcrR family transcriptional regulator [Bauldia sp.]|nr:TetR/AcrR family transcriptional regulator [Bauldia sp.]MCW5719188.1 TetR/AcrR family transcriptional regulator [Bauldia sp.]
MRSRGANTRSEILRAGAAIVREGGPMRLTFDEIAARLGVSKQAVIYWFPNKEALIASLALPALRAETDAAIAALAGVPPGMAAVRAFAHALIDFHLSDLDRFRLTYIAVQMPGASVEPSPDLKEQIHATTRPMYDAIEDLLTHVPKARRRPSAMAIHMAVLGFVLLTSLSDTVRDPLLHRRAELVAALLAILAPEDAVEGRDR